MWTHIEPEELRNIILSKLDDRDGTDFNKVEHALDEVIDFFFPDKIYIGPESEKVLEARKLVFEFIIKSSVEATLEVINLQNQRLAKELDDIKKSADN